MLRLIEWLEAPDHTPGYAGEGASSSDHDNDNSWLDLLRFSRKFQAMNPRDKAFALLCVAATLVLGDKVKADYDRPSEEC